jgi:DNA-binding transcriptional LysR family regulator
MKVRVDHTDELVAMVEQGDVELGLILDPVMRSELLIVKELFRQPLQLLVPVRHPLAQTHTAVPLQRIKDEPLLLLDETSRLGQITNRIFAQRGFAVRPVIEIESIEGLKELVRQGMGVTLTLPALVRSARNDNDLVLLPIDDVKEEFIFALIYPRSDSISHAARAFINAISQ